MKVWMAKYPAMHLNFVNLAGFSVHTTLRTVRFVVRIGARYVRLDI